MTKEEYDFTAEVRKAEMKRLIRKIGMRRALAMNKAAHEKKDPFVLFHFGQQLAYEEAITIIKEVFYEDFEGDEE